jgi:hypothetical protein
MLPSFLSFGFRVLNSVFEFSSIDTIYVRRFTLYSVTYSSYHHIIDPRAIFNEEVGPKGTLQGIKLRVSLILNFNALRSPSPSSSSGGNNGRSQLTLSCGSPLFFTHFLTDRTNSLIVSVKSFFSPTIIISLLVLPLLLVGHLT